MVINNNFAGTDRPVAGKHIFCVFCILLFVSAASAQTDLQQLVYQRQYAAVMDDAMPLQKEDSADFRTMYAVGQAYEGLLRYREAYDCYRHCLSLRDTAGLDLLNAMARMAANIGMIREAETCFLRALTIDSVDFYTNHQLARLYFQSDDYEKAVGYYLYLLNLYPDHPVLFRGAGDCFSRMNLLPAAAMYYRKAFDFNRENAGVASALVNTLLMLEQAEAAVSICDTALMYSPDSRTLRRTMGIALFTAKRYEQADSLYTLLTEQGDSSYMTLKYSAFSRYYRGKYVDAIDLFESAYRMDTTAVDVCLYFGSTLGRTYDRRRACQLFDRAELWMQPKPALVNLLMQFRGETYAREGRLDEAAALFYALWQKEQRAEMLDHIRSLYDTHPIAAIKDEDRRQRALFIYALIASECENSPENKKTLLYHVRGQLQAFQEEMFLQGKTAFPMLAPDDTKSMLSKNRLQELIRQLPEKPE
jgi:tetratricopeptide (TPR) repeat protein